jgi:hypothetical protein
MTHVSNRDDVQYYEEVPAHPIFRFALLLGIGVLAYLGLEVPRAPRIALIFVSAMIAFIYINFMTLKIIIDSRRLIVGFGLIRQSIRLSNIEYIETRRPPWYWYGGLGVRFGWDWSIGFLQNFGEGVRVTPIHGRRFFFSTNNPDAIVNIVNDLRQKQGTLQ